MKKLIILLLAVLLVGSVYAEKIKTEDNILKYGESIKLDFAEGGKYQLRTYEDTQIDFTINGKGRGTLIIDEIGEKEIKVRIKRKDEKFYPYIIKIGTKERIDIAEGVSPDLNIEPRVVHYSEDRKQRNVVLYFNSFFKLRTGQTIEDFKKEHNLTAPPNNNNIQTEQPTGKIEEKAQDYTIFFVVTIIVLVILFIFFKFIRKENNEGKPRETKIDEEDVYVAKDERSVKLETTKSVHTPEDSGLNIEPKPSSKQKKSLKK